MLTKQKQFRNRLWFFLIAVVIGAVGCGPPGPRALLQGKRLMEEGKYPEAVERLKVATSLMATNAQAWNYLGLAYHHAGAPAEAIAAYEKALRVNRDMVVTHYNLGCLLLEQNKLAAARDELTAFNLQERNSLDGALKLGVAQLRLRDLVSAEKNFAEALRLSPHNAEALNDLGVIQMQRNRPRDAAGYFEEASRQKPDYGPALLNLAMVSQNYLNNRAMALQKYQAYLALTPRAANWEKVNATARQLEEELNAPSHTAVVNPATIPITPANNPTRTVAAVTNTPKAETVAAVAKPATNVPVKATPPPAPPPPAKPEVVQVQEQPVVKVAGNVTAPKPSTVQSTTEPVVVDQPPDVGTETKAEKRGLLQRLNPINLFHRDPKPVGNPEPLPPVVTVQGGSANAAAVSTNAMAMSKTTSSRPGVPARYAYLTPPKPAAGNHPQAEELFAQGVQAQRDRRIKEAVTLYRATVAADPAFFEAQSNLGLAAYDLGDMGQSLQAYEMALAINPGSFNARFNFALALKKANYLQDAAVELEKLLASHPPDESSAHLALAHLTVANLYAEQFHQVKPARAHYLKVLELDPQNRQATAIRYWLRDNP